MKKILCSILLSAFSFASPAATGDIELPKRGSDGKLHPYIINGTPVTIDASGNIVLTSGTGILVQAGAGISFNPGSILDAGTGNSITLNGLVPSTRRVNNHQLNADVTVTKGDVGLGNVDNTSDANKPVSTAQGSDATAKANAAQSAAIAVAASDATTKASSAQAAAVAASATDATSKANTAQAAAIASAASDATAKVAVEAARATSAETTIAGRVTTAEGNIGSNTSAISALQSASNGLDATKYQGLITALSQNLASASTAGAGAYYVATLPGVLTGTNSNGQTVQAAGDYIVSTGSVWVSRPAGTVGLNPLAFYAGLPAETNYGYYPRTGTRNGSSNAGLAFYNQPVLVPSLLTQVYFDAYTSGTGKINIYRKSGDNLSVVRSISVTMAAGDNTYTPATFGTQILQVGEGVAVYSTGRYTTYSGDPSELQAWIKLSTDMASTSVTSDYVITNASVGMSWRAQPLAQPSYGTTATNAKYKRWDETFGSTAPAAWTFASTWTYSSGMQPPSGASDMSQRATLGSYIAGDNVTLRWVVQASSTTDVMGLGIKDNCLASIDGGSGVFAMRATGNNTSAWPATSQTASASLVSGRIYVLTQTRDRRKNTFVFTDTVTGTAATIVEDKDNSAGTNYTMASGAMDGYPVIINRVGQMKVLSFSVYYNQPRVRFLFAGDSIPAGYNLTVGQTYPQLLKAAGVDSILTWAIGGSSITVGASGVLAMIRDLRPEWLIGEWGTNDTDSNLGQFKFNFWIIKQYCQIYGVKLAWVHLPDTPAKTLNQLEAFAALYSDREIKAHLALTVGNDGSTFNSGMYQGDNFHLNAAGQSAVMSRFAIDLPEIYR